MMAGQKYYAVYNGKQGTQIYLTWDEVRRSNFLNYSPYSCRAEDIRDERRVQLRRQAHAFRNVPVSVRTQ